MVRQVCEVLKVSCGGVAVVIPGEVTVKLGFGGSFRIHHKVFLQVLGPLRPLCPLRANDIHHYPQPSVDLQPGQDSSLWALEEGL